MINERIEEVRAAIEDMLLRLGFIKLWVQFQCPLPNGKIGEFNYTHDNLHCHILIHQNWPDIYGIEKDWVLIEYANNLQEAKLHMYEDGDMIPIDLELSQIIGDMENEVRQSIV